MPSSEARLTLLEEKFSYQEQLLHELSEVLYAQQREFELLTARMV